MAAERSAQTQDGERGSNGAARPLDQSGHGDSPEVDVYQPMLALRETLAWPFAAGNCLACQKLVDGCDSGHGEILGCGYCSKGKSATADTEQR